MLWLAGVQIEKLKAKQLSLTDKKKKKMLLSFCSHFRETLWLSVSLILSINVPPLQLQPWQKDEYIMNSSWKPVIISSSLMCPCCDSRVCFIQPPTPICTSSAALSSVHADVRRGWLYSNILYSATSWTGSLMRERSLHDRTVIDSRGKESPRITQAHWGAGDQHDINSVMHLHFLLCFWFCPFVKLSQGASSVPPQSYPLVLQLLPHMFSARSSVAFVDVLTDGNRNSSTNRPILWLTGER